LLNFFIEFIPPLKNLYLKNAKDDLLVYIKALHKAGFTITKAIETKLYSLKEKDPFAKQLKIALNEISKKGTNELEALFLAKVLDEQEKMILSEAKGNLPIAIDQIIAKNKGSKASFKIYSSIFGPPLIALVLLLSTHGLVKDIVAAVFEPMKQAGAKSDDFPEYLVNIKYYIMWNIFAFSIFFSFIGTVFYLKKFNYGKFLWMMPFARKEYAIDILYYLKTSLSSGVTLAKATESLSKKEKNNIKRYVYSKIFNLFKTGRTKNIHQVFEDLHFDKHIVASLKLAEDSKDLIAPIEAAYEAAMEDYALKLKKWTILSKIIGQTLMMVVLFKPMVDLLLLMSIKQLNFTV